MCRILIVDDEPIAVESVVYTIKKNFVETYIVGTSRSGKDAIEKAYDLRPDIIIMDINMPGINGLEAMRQIRTVNPNVMFLVISAFDYFDYAVESVTLGVMEYLLKPVKEVRLVEVLTKAIKEVNRNKTIRQKNLEQQEKLEIVIPILETGFINSLCLYSDNAKELHNYGELFGYDKACGYVMVIELGEKKCKTIENKIGAGVQGEKMYGEYKTIIKSLCSCAVGPIMLNRIIVYVFEEEMLDVFSQKSASVHLAQNILNKALRLSTDIHIGVGKFYPNIEDSKKSYQDALYALRFIEASSDENHIQILHVDDIIEKIEYTVRDYEELIEEIIFEKIVDKDETLIQNGFHQIFTKMIQDNQMTLVSIKNCMIGLVVGLRTRWESASENYYTIINLIINATNSEILYDVTNRYLMEVMGQILLGRQKKVNSIINKANEYIKTNFDKEISLEDVAKEVNLSSYYFSRFYKEESGINFSDMLASVRIERAKELLRKEEYSIKDVCFMVGYMEPNYFSKIFKKITGYTASEYKRIHGK